MVGFHSEAAGSPSRLSRLVFDGYQKLSWVHKAASKDETSGGDFARQVQSGASRCGGEAQEKGESPATGAYLIPFLAILEPLLSPRRLLDISNGSIPCALFRACRHLDFPLELRKLNWRFGWLRH